jgi:hypothetical protein
MERKWKAENADMLFQLSFWVKKYFMPDSRMICGYAPVRPNESGSHPVSQRLPNLTTFVRFTKS